MFKISLKSDLLILVSSQLVPKSTRTLVNSYPFLVNSYLTFGQLVPTPGQLVPESKNGAGWSLIDRELVSLCPNKPFQTQKHHNLLSVLRLGSGQPVQRSQLLCLWGGILEADLIIHHNLVFAIGIGSGQLWQVPLPFSYGSMFGIACLKRPNQHSFAFCNKGRFGQAFSNIKKTPL